MRRLLVRIDRVVLDGAGDAPGGLPALLAEAIRRHLHDGLAGAAPAPAPRAGAFPLLRVDAADGSVDGVGRAVAAGVERATGGGRR